MRRGIGSAKVFWEGARAWELSPSERALFPADGLNECRPGVFRGTRVVLVTARPTGVAVVRAADGIVLFATAAPEGVEAAEVLPGDVLATASSDAGVVRLHSTTTGKAADYPLEGACGVVWDSRGSTLWALGAGRLESYSFNMSADDPALVLGDARELPGSGARDLYPRAWKNEVFLALDNGVWTFSVEGGGIARFSQLAGVNDALSASERGSNGTVVYTNGGDSLLFADPARTMKREGSAFTCARWDRLQELTYGYRTPYAELDLAPPTTTLSTGR
jgi:hypothetical protein